MTSPCPLNPDTDPGRDIPLSEVPQTIRGLRESWAREYHRANTLELALERSQQATSDWQAIAIQNGEEAAKARVECERNRQARIKAERRAEECEAAHEWLCDLLKRDDLGEDCDECKGTGSVYESELVPSSGRPEDYTERLVQEDCTNCFDGRLPRAGAVQS